MLIFVLFSDQILGVGQKSLRGVGKLWMKASSCPEVIPYRQNHLGYFLIGIAQNCNAGSVCHASEYDIN